MARFEMRVVEAATGTGNLRILGDAGTGSPTRMTLDLRGAPRPDAADGVVLMEATAEWGGVANPLVAALPARISLPVGDDETAPLIGFLLGIQLLFGLLFGGGYEWVAGLSVHKRLPGGFAVNTGLRYVSDRFGNLNNSVSAAGYTTLDAGVSYTLGRTSVTLRGRNLTDEVYEPVAGTTMRRLADPRSAELSIRTQF